MARLCTSFSPSSLSIFFNANFFCLRLRMFCVCVCLCASKYAVFVRPLVGRLINRFDSFVSPLDSLRRRRRRRRGGRRRTETDQRDRELHRISLQAEKAQRGTENSLGRPSSIGKYRAHTNRQTDTESRAGLSSESARVRARAKSKSKAKAKAKARFRDRGKATASARYLNCTKESMRILFPSSCLSNL